MSRINDTGNLNGIVILVMHQNLPAYVIRYVSYIVAQLVGVKT